MSKQKIFMKNNRLGSYIVKKISGESYKCYIPPLLPIKPEIDLSYLSCLIEKSIHSISELNNLAKIVPNTELFLYMYVRKEALLSSQIEGTQSSFSDLLLFEQKQKINISKDDVEEVSNYIKALKHGIKRMNDGFPLSLRLIKEIHAILLSGTRGADKIPGEFRKSQNWIGGTRPGNAFFVPPSIEYLNDSLSNFEQFLHNNKTSILVKAAISHAQFETIHPFLDGNGRIGRLLITLLLIQHKILDSPILYLSLYLKENRSLYYDLLQETRLKGNWETWIEFFINGILYTSKQEIKTINEINNLFIQDQKQIDTLGRQRFSCTNTLHCLKRMPQISVDRLATELDISQPTARTALTHLLKLNIVEEITGKQRDKIYVYRKYLDILEQGSQPL
jgi:Fic family protein